MKRLWYLINDQSHLTESNIVNAGGEDIVIRDNEGNEVDTINTFNKILSKYLKNDIFKARTPTEVKQWFERNFVKWIKNGAADRDDDMMDEKVFQKTFYVPLSEYIDDLLNNEKNLVKQGKLTKDIVLKSFPEYVQKNPTDAVVFSGGRLFRLKKITPSVEKLHEFLIAVEQNKANRNDVIMPPMFVSKRLDVLQVPEAFKRTKAWHQYTEQQAEKVSAAQEAQMVKALRLNHDYKVLTPFESGNKMVQLLTGKAASVEGTIMKHCVASYGGDIEKGKTTIYSLRNKDNIPVATIEMKGTQAVQVKGPHNSTIKPEYHDDLRQFFKSKKISVGADARNFNGMKEK